MAYPRIKLSDNSGNEVSVTSNRLDVNAYLSATPEIDIGDVSLLLGGTAASVNNGAADATTLRVTIASDTTGVLSVDDNGSTLSIDDGGGTITVDGTVTANLSATDNGVLDAIAASLEILDDWDDSNYANVNLNVAGTDVDTDTGVFGAQTLRVTLAANDLLTTFMVNDLDTIASDTTEIASYFWSPGIQFTSQKGINTLAIRDDVLNSIGGAGIGDGDLTPIKANKFGALYADGAEIENEAVAGNPSLIGGRFDSSARTLGDGDAGAVALNASGHVLMDVVDGGQLDALLDTIKVDTEAIETAVELLDNAIDGSEMQVDVVAALPAGTNAIGKLAANSGVDIGDVDVTSMPSDTFVAGDGVYGKGVLLQGDDGSDRHNIRCDTGGNLFVEIQNGGAIVQHDVNAGGSAFMCGAEAKEFDGSALPNNVNAEGDVTRISGSLYGIQYNMPVNEDGSKSPIDQTSGQMITTHGITGLSSDDNDTVGTSAEKISGADGDVACKRIDIMAHPNNTGEIWVGDSAITTNGENGGIRLLAGDFYSMDIDNTADVYVIATVDGENVCFNYFT